MLFGYFVTYFLTTIYLIIVTSFTLPYWKNRLYTRNGGFQTYT